jgi:NAD-dependent dihydropyrimidine dehydrogenase PreA subunit
MKRKIITIDQDKCDGCGLCVTACHEGAIQLINGKATLISESYCDGFGDCLPACHADAIKIVEKEADKYDEEAVKKNTQNSSLMQWPCQIKLVSPTAPYFNNNHLLIAADCTAYAYADFHKRMMNNKITLIGCPKLDNVYYEEKLTSIISLNDIKSVTVVKMQVPCCKGIADAVKNALINSQKTIPFSVITLSTDGRIVEM